MYFMFMYTLCLYIFHVLYTLCLYILYVYIYFIFKDTLCLYILCLYTPYVCTYFMFIYTLCLYILYVYILYVYINFMFIYTLCLYILYVLYTLCLHIFYVYIYFMFIYTLCVYMLYVYIYFMFIYTLLSTVQLYFYHTNTQIFMFIKNNSYIQQSIRSRNGLYNQGLLYDIHRYIFTDNFYFYSSTLYWKRVFYVWLCIISVSSHTSYVEQHNKSWAFQSDLYVTTSNMIHPAL
jgi:hypothetical protein